MRQLTYIQSSGTQYIDTGYIATSENYRIKCKFTTVNNDINTVLFGGGASTDIISALLLSTTQIKFYVGSGSVSSCTATFVQGTETDLECYANNGAFTVTLESTGDIYNGSYSDEINKSYPLFIFGNNVSGSPSQLSSIRISEFQIYDNDILVRDFIPAINDDNDIGLYDNVNKVFYSNAGTGTFTAGEYIDEGEDIFPELFTCTFSNVLNNQNYYARIYPVNPQGFMQSELDGQITIVTSGGNDSSSVPSTVTNFILSGNEFNVAISWTNPTEDNYLKTIIVQKNGSAPTSLTDGTQVYSGTGTSCNITDLSPSTTYYYAAFAIDNNSNYAEDFPVKSYTTPAYVTLTSTDTGTFSLTGGSVWSDSNLAISGMKFYTSRSIYGNRGQVRSAYAASANAIDVTNYSKLQFKATSSVTIDYDYSGDNYEHTAYCYLYFGICDTSNRATSTFTKKATVSSSGTYELDVSGLSGNYYLKFMFQSRDNEDGGADIDYSCTISDIKLYP